MQIIGAGLAGLIAAQVFPRAEVFEANSSEKITHKAVLRFRSTKVADTVGVDFRRVKVHKGIWMDGKFVDPSIQLANYYSRKVIGKLADRSIWNLDPVERFIAPEDFISILAEQAGSRVHWSTPYDFVGRDKNEPVISTMPMSAMAKLIGASTVPKFGFKEIYVSRFRVANADTFQTVYFPALDNPVYRASITGDLLIIEAVDGIVPIDDVMQAFGIGLHDIELIDSDKQSFGKIAPIDDTWRKNFIYHLSVAHNIYSVGRFATWRNILLDDVVQDVSVVKKLIGAGIYSHSLRGV